MEMLEAMNAENETGSTPLNFLFGDVETSEESSPLRTGDIYGRFDYDEPLLLLREKMLAHCLVQIRNGRGCDMGTPLTQLATSLTSIEVAAVFGTGPDWARRAVLLRLAHTGVGPETTAVQLAVLRDETYRCFIALGEEARKDDALHAEIQRIRAELLRHALGAGRRQLPPDPRRIIQEMVLSRHGNRIWCELTSAAERDVDRLPVADRGADVLASRLIELGARILGRSRDDFLHDLMTYCNEMVGRVSGSTVLEVLANLNEVHESIARVAPKYPLPRFEADNGGPMHCYRYDSNASAAWATTLATALGQRFGTPVHLRPRGEDPMPISRGLLSLVPPARVARFSITAPARQETCAA